MTDPDAHETATPHPVATATSAAPCPGGCRPLTTAERKRVWASAVCAWVIAGVVAVFGVLAVIELVDRWGSAAWPAALLLGLMMWSIAGHLVVLYSAVLTLRLAGHAVGTRWYGAPQGPALLDPQGCQSAEVSTWRRRHLAMWLVVLGLAMLLMLWGILT